MNMKTMRSGRRQTAAISVLMSVLLALSLSVFFGASAAAAMPTCGYNVSASVVGGHGSVSPTRQSVGRGKTATIHINPDAGHHIAKIIDNCRAMPIANPYKITNVRNRHEVYVTFGLDEFAINASVQGWHGMVNPATQSVFYRGTASIDLTPGTGYHVAAVTDNGSSMPVADPYVINNVNAIHNVVVAFTASSYNVTASVHGGNGTAIPASQAVAAGGTAAIILNPATGYELATISDNGSEVPPSSPYVMSNVSRDHDVVATFNPVEYTVTATVA